MCKIETDKVEVKWLQDSGWNIWFYKLHLGSTYGIADAIDIAQQGHSGWTWAVIEGGPIDHWPFVSSKLVGKREVLKHWAKFDSSSNCPHAWRKNE
jgi:hypothetical protein